MAGTEREPAEVRIPKAALDAFAAALSVRTVAVRTRSNDGLSALVPGWEEPETS